MLRETRSDEVWCGKWRGDYVAVKIFLSKEEKTFTREVAIYSEPLFAHDNILVHTLELQVPSSSDASSSQRCLCLVCCPSFLSSLSSLPSFLSSLSSLAFFLGSGRGTYF